MFPRLPLPLVVGTALVLVLVACGWGEKAVSLSEESPVVDTRVPQVTTDSVLCDYSGSMFNTSPSVHAIASWRWSCWDAERRLSSNGLPDHAVGTFPNPDNPNTLSPRIVSAALALTPVLTTQISARSGPRVPMGFVLNGVKLDPGTAGTCDDTGSACALGPSPGHWNIEALGQSHFRFGMDSSNGHVQPGGAYHYHGVPEGFVAKLNKGQAMTLIAWALDGFPIYARYGYSVAADARSPVKVMRGSYALKAVPDPQRPPVSQFAMGSFTQDYEYRAGSGDLDECNGRFGVTPEFPTGIYHYYATDGYPYIQRCVKGKL
jgi:hypothetical protein